jgi:Uncharacterised nucleotidyltransferase
VSLASETDERALWALHLAARRTLVDATKVLDAAEIPSVAVKGAVTAYSLYREPTERPLGDVDVRIRPRDFRRAARAFEGAGWRVFDWKRAYGAFVATRGGVCVDVESVIGAPGLCAMTVEEMLERATRTLPRTEVRVPELHDHAVLSCVNVFKDKLVLALPWAVEDARRMGDVAGFDPDRFVARAREAKVATIAWIVADWLVRERPTAGWAKVKEKLGGDRAPRPLYSWAFRKLRGSAPRSLAMRLVARAGADDVRMRAEGLTKAVAFKASRTALLRRLEARGLLGDAGCH